MLTHKGIAFIVLLASLLMPCLVRAQSTGNISGKVLDSQTGEPLPGANVLIKVTGIGASTNLDGNYSIENAPAGANTIRVSYIGYTTREVAVQVREGTSVTLNVELQAVGIKGKEVVITAQASGQNAAINQQLASQNIVNVVSAARIKELPDANAAESVGRLPGVFLVRSYGEGSQVAIRGLAPQYNQVLIDGVQMPSTDNNNRSVDMSMISSDMLSGIELFKTVTPNMDANVLGGTVNFQIREAGTTPTGAPRIDILGQGGYDNLQGTYNDYKFSATVEKRFGDNAFGVLAQGIVERKNLTADIFGGSYGQLKSSYTDLGSVVLNTLSLTYKPTEKQRYDGTLVLDYRWNGGKVDFMNFLSRGSQATETFQQNYNMNSNNNSISFLASQYIPVTNVITDIVDLQENVLSFNMDARVSHAYTENINPDYWSLTFSQGSAGVSGVNQALPPVQVAQQAATYANLDQANLSGISTNSSFTRQRNIACSVDFERNINFSDVVTADLRFGGKYRYTIRSYNYTTGGGANLDNPAEGAGAVRAQIIAANPWMVPWLSGHGLQTNGDSPFPITMFFDPSNGFDKFLGGDYSMLGDPTNIGVLSQVRNEIIASQIGHVASTGNYYAPDEKESIASDYHGTEAENAGYVMATINFGPGLTLIPGLRYQGLRTRYTAAFIPLWGSVNTYPFPFPHIDTTAGEYHGYWLPDVSLRYKPFTWLDVRLSYTNTLSYPDFQYLTPQIQINSSVQPGSVNRWNNFNLKPARSQNYDLALSVYDNTIGLFSVNPFLKQIDDFIFTYGGFGITDPSVYPLPAYTRNYILSNTQLNNPNRVNLWGVELDWQTHFWYLPSVLSGLVMNVNFTHIFSQAKYPIHFSETVGTFPNYRTVEVDTFYTARLIDQPVNIVNFSIGYDYIGFSARASMIYQADVFSGTNFWPALRRSKANYIRWGFSAKQDLPWYGVQVYLDINNLNGEPDVTVIQGSGYPTAEESYGLTADLGLRWSF